MKAEEIVLLAVKHAVLAFRKETGERLWSTKVTSSLGDSFVSLIADETKVYAHSGGELHCLDLFTGAKLWKDELSGYGYGIASLALPGGISSGAPAIRKSKEQEEARQASS